MSGSGERVDAVPPVVLVHGFLSTAELMAPLVARLASRGFDVHQPRLSPLCIQDVRKLSGQLARDVDRVLERSGAPRCALVGVSQGGIIALHYLKRGLGASKVTRLVAVASPFSGTWAPIAGLVGAPLLGWASRGLWQVIPGSALLTDLRDAPMPEGVAVTTIAVEGDLVAPPSRCRLDGARHVTVPGVPLLAHQWIVLSPAVVDAVTEALRGPIR